MSRKTFLVNCLISIIILQIAAVIVLCSKEPNQQEERRVIPQAQMTENRIFELRPMDQDKPIWMAVAERNAIELDGEIVSFSWNSGKGLIVAESIEDRGVKNFVEDIYQTRDPDGNPIEFRIEMREGQLVAGCYKQ